MKNDDLANMYTTQQSFTEWLSDIGYSKTEEFRQEDNEKRERLRALSKVIEIPFDEPNQFTGEDLANNSDAHKKYLHKYGAQHCALRLIPLQKGLPKLRMRGLTVEKAYEWFKEQEIDPLKYRADYMPHTENSNWATIFIVNKHGIYGELIEGGHHQLTQGFYDNLPPIVFHYDFDEWTLSRESDGALEHLKRIVRHLYVPDKKTQQNITEEFKIDIHSDYIAGYWETADSDDYGLWFVDFNRILAEIFGDSKPVIEHDGTKNLLAGMSASDGKANGPVNIIIGESLQGSSFEDGEVLVCEMTTPDYVPYMKQCAAIVTDNGGVLSHAAIVARELKKPCIVGTKKATKVLRNRQIVTVDGQKAAVY